MPEQIQTAEVSTRLAKRFRLQGRLPMELDEIIVPVVIVDDLNDSDAPPPAFGKAPGPDLASRTFVMSSGHALRITAGTSSPLLLVDAWVTSNSARVWVVFVGTIAVGTIAIAQGGSSWAARRPGSPSAKFEERLITGAGSINPDTSPALAHLSPGNGVQSTPPVTPLDISIPASTDDTLNSVTILPCNVNSAGNFDFITGTDPVFLTLRWRE